MERYTHKHIADILRSSHRPIFVSDERIDGDSLGSALAMVDWMSGFGARPPVFVATDVPEQYRFLPHVDVCTTDASIFLHPDVDVVVVFDCSDAGFIKRLLGDVLNQPIIINIDHHKTNPGYGNINQVVVDAPATAQVVHTFFETNHIIPSRHAATCLLTGMCFDTNAFSNSATNDAVLNKASQLILLGARVQDVIRTMFHHRSVGALRVWGLALERLCEHAPTNIVTTCLTRKDVLEHGVDDDEIDGLSNFLNLVTDTHTLMVLRETEDGGVKVSMRSRVYDVSLHAKQFGGGGHAKAAGFTLPASRLVCLPEKGWGVVQNNEHIAMANALRFELFENGQSS